jgi:hypothetical protein
MYSQYLENNTHIHDLPEERKHINEQVGLRGNAYDTYSGDVSFESLSGHWINDSFFFSEVPRPFLK